MGALLAHESREHMASRDAAKSLGSTQPSVSELPSDDWRKLAVFALLGLFLLALCLTLWAAQAVFIPIVLALLVSYALQPVHRVFLRAGMPAAVAAVLTITLTGAVVGGAA